MLLSLRIENFALIDQLELEFGPGLNVVTGETGAGKSIILDALDAALGGKVTSRAIRTGAERAIIEATFMLDSWVAEWVRAQEIDLLDGNALVASRELSVTQSGFRSRSRLNGILVNRQLMDLLRDRLVEITAQGQTIQLTTAAKQRDLLDLYGGSALVTQRQIVADRFFACQQALEILDRRRHSEQERLQRLDWLEFQVNELSAANLSDPDELSQLESERQRLNHVVDLQQQSYQVYQALYQNDGEGNAAADLIAQAEATLTDMVRFDSHLQPLLDNLSEALAQVIEVGRCLSDYGASLEADPQRLQDVEERIMQLKQICRKYGPSLADAIAYQQRIHNELEDLTSSGKSLEVLEKAYQVAQTDLENTCAQLTRLRQTAAQELEARLVGELKPLAMEKVQFQVEIAPTAPSSFGADKVMFLLSPNTGEPLQPLSEIASGGEMSRFLLALKACFSQSTETCSLVFDEIDAGVSGRVAQAIAQKLHQLSHHHQVLCVTHQPIVAAMADSHFRVDKQLIEQAATQPEMNPELNNDPGLLLSASAVRTVVRVSVLDAQARREELAQLASGQSAQPAISFAESLLDRAADLRSSHAERSPSTPTVSPTTPTGPTALPSPQANAPSPTSKSPKKNRQP